MSSNILDEESKEDKSHKKRKINDIDISS